MSKTAKGLVDWCQQFVGHPYWYGTFGQKPTEALLMQKKRQFDSIGQTIHYQESRLPTYRQHIRAGKEVFDCVGLIQGYMWWNGQRIVYDASTDVNANGMLNRAAVKGPIASMPDRPGLCVWFQNHIGVYVGNGMVVEARGFAHGVQLTRLSQRPWREWLECPYIAYAPAGPQLTLEVNGRNVPMVMKNVSGRTFVQLEGEHNQKHWIQVRALAETLGIPRDRIGWDANTQTVRLEVR